VSLLLDGCDNKERTTSNTPESASNGEPLEEGFCDWTGKMISFDCNAPTSMEAWGKSA
jgi:hypothetical protein